MARQEDDVPGLAARALSLASLLVLASLPACAEEPWGCRTIAVLVSPAEPTAGATLRIVVAGDLRPDDVVIQHADGRTVEAERVTYDDTPASVVTTIARAEPGGYRIGVRGAAGVEDCGGVLVADTAVPPASRGGRGAWPSRVEWSRRWEDLYSAWIEHLFAAPPDVETSFPSLEPLLRDPARNFLHDRLGLGEDDPGRAMPATPDCADLPYLLRAYFAWKVGLPFGYRRCDRGSPTTPPRCGQVTTNEDPAAGDGPLGAFPAFARNLMSAVHSGSARTALDDDATDFYPVPLGREAIRPGTIYADPYGHTLVVVGWTAQTADRPGILHAVDAQPDNTVARKRFWEGTFLFAAVPSAGPGFKAFRPLVHDEPGGRLRAPSNDELSNDRRFVPWSDEQEEISVETFYARMGGLANPNGLEPERAYEATLDALVEQLETRVRSVDNGERYVHEHPGTLIPMPEGAAIFETSGAWEDYATPSRDFRLIIALHVLEDLPERIVRHPELFVLGGRAPEMARADVERLHAQRIAERAIEYTRSDGGPWRLTVADVLARTAEFEVGYDPNDCVEVRWGAPDGTTEQSTCRRRAPAEQRARMESYREWFRESRRPID
jgi:hypothetical protein